MCVIHHEDLCTLYMLSLHVICMYVRMLFVSLSTNIYYTFSSSLMKRPKAQGVTISPPSQLRYVRNQNMCMHGMYNMCVIHLVIYTYIRMYIFLSV